MIITMNEKSRSISVQQKSEVFYLKRNMQEERVKRNRALPRNFGVHRVLLPLYLGINNDTN